MNQRGFTLIELLLGMGAGVVILASVVGALYVITRGTPEIRDDLAALAEIQRAAHWLSRDVMQGLEADLVDLAGPVAEMGVTWIDYTKAAEAEGAIAHAVSYTWSPGTGELERNYDGVVTIIANNLTNVEFSRNDKLVTVTLTSTIDGNPGATVTRTYTFLMRAEDTL